MGYKTRKFIKTICKVASRTKRHRPAVWECILGTVVALNDEGELRYFDYDHDAALAFAGVSPDRDPRVYKVRRQDNFSWTKKRRPGYYWVNEPRIGQLVLWIKEIEGCQIGEAST